MSTGARIPRSNNLNQVKSKDFIPKDYDLVNVNDMTEGIRRYRIGEDFEYRLDKRLLKSKKQLKRINSLVIPPAWEKVLICTLENGHLQATGYDQRNRKQYRYHETWVSLSQQKNMPTC